MIKKLVYSLVAVVTIAAMLLVSQPMSAVTVSGLLINPTNRTAILNGAHHLNSITLYNIGTNTTVFGFFDAPGTTNAGSANAIAITFTNAAYTNYTITSGSVSNALFTNIFGVITTNFYLALTRTTNNVLGTNMPAAMVGLIAGSSNVPVTLTFGANQFSAYGLVVTNLTTPAGGVFYSVDYDNKR